MWDLKHRFQMTCYSDSLFVKDAILYKYMKPLRGRQDRVCFFKQNVSRINKDETTYYIIILSSYLFPKF
jgi:hypothetical protein